MYACNLAVVMVTTKLIFLSRNALATTTSTKMSCAKLLSEHKYTVKNQSLELSARPTSEEASIRGGSARTLQQTGAKKKIVYISSRPV